VNPYERTTYPRKLNTGAYDEWIAHPQGSGGDNDRLIERRAEVLVHAEHDESESYEYEEYAIVSLGDEWFFLETSGCSCPSPSETWQIIASGTKQELAEKLGAWERWTGCERSARVRESLLPVLA
jgi:hypothetical protein